MDEGDEKLDQVVFSLSELGWLQRIAKARSGPRQFMTAAYLSAVEDHTPREGYVLYEAEQIVDSKQEAAEIRRRPKRDQSVILARNMLVRAQIWREAGTERMSQLADQLHRLIKIQDGEEVYQEAVAAANAFLDKLNARWEDADGESRPVGVLGV